MATNKKENTGIIRKIMSNELLHILFYVLIIIISIAFIYFYYREWVMYFVILIAVAFLATFFIHLFRKQ